jgi:signal transduction histidine kinase
VTLRFMRDVALAVLFVAAAYAATLGLRLFTPRVYFILFVPAVMFATWFGGLAAGMLASALTVAAAAFLVPSGEVGDQLVWVIVAGVVTFMTSAVTAARRRTERQLAALAAAERARRHEAESLCQLKTDLLAQVAHELRQPLSALSVGTRLLDVTQSETVRQRTIAVLDRQTEHLRRLVDDLLDLSKLTRHELQLRKSKFDLCQVVGDTVDVIASDAAVRGLDLSSTLPQCPLYVNADQTRVRQILSNLLSNAVKFTPTGGKIALSIEQTVSHIVMRVRDTGRGIAPDSLPLIFDMFHTGNDEDSGLGVGLAVVKGLAEVHGGSVEARSPGVGGGSEFIVTLPVLAEQPTASAQTA